MDLTGQTANIVQSSTSAPSVTVVAQPLVMPTTPITEMTRSSAKRVRRSLAIQAVPSLIMFSVRQLPPHRRNQTNYQRKRNHEVWLVCIPGVNR